MAVKALGPKDSRYRIISNGKGIPALLDWLKSVALYVPSNSNACANIDELPYVLTPKEVAGVFRTTVAAIYARVERGPMPGVVRDGRKLFFTGMASVVLSTVPHPASSSSPWRPGSLP